eukprot:1655600-Rhodomonas_salina.1
MGARLSDEAGGAAALVNDSHAEEAPLAPSLCALELLQSQRPLGLEDGEREVAGKAFAQRCDAHSNARGHPPPDPARPVPEQ